MKRLETKDLCLCAVFAALAAIGAFIRIPMPICPKTLQLFFVTLGGMLLGKKLGAASVAIYVIIGLLGVPVFTGGGGFGYVLQPTFGYLPGFILSAYITGLITERSDNPSFLRLLAAALAGMLVAYIIGMVYLYIICNYVLGMERGIKAVLMSCFVIIAPGDIVLSVIAAFLGKRIIPILKKQNKINK